MPYVIRLKPDQPGANDKLWWSAAPKLNKTLETTSWTEDIDRAVQFHRQQDAERVALNSFYVSVVVEEYPLKRRK